LAHRLTGGRRSCNPDRNWATKNPAFRRDFPVLTWFTFELAILGRLLAGLLVRILLLLAGLLAAALLLAGLLVRILVLLARIWVPDRSNPGTKPLGTAIKVNKGFKLPVAV